MQILWKRINRRAAAVIENNAFQVLVLGTLLAMPAFLGEKGTRFAKCIVKTTTGIDCPGCGLTRSFVQLCHGHLSQSFAYHPLGPLLYVFFVFLLGNRLSKLIRGRQLLPWVEAHYTYTGFALALLVIWAFRVQFA